MTKQHPLIFKLALALEAGDERSTDQAISGVLNSVEREDNSFGDAEVENVNNLLRDHRQHEYMIAYGEILSSEGRNTFNTDKHYAQALIDTGMPTSALSLLTSMIRESETRGSFDDFAESCGLIGRIHKDLYLLNIDSKKEKASSHLRKAFQAYSQPWKRKPRNSIWHGVNLLALCSNSIVNGFTIPDCISGNEIAESIIETVLLMDVEARNYWDWASLAEAYVWRENWPLASRALVGALDAGAAKPFQLNGTLRQFKELWVLQERGSEAAILVTWLERTLIGQPNSEIVLDAKDVDRQQSVDEAKLQALHSHHRMRTGEWVKKFMLRGESVASVLDINSGAPKGTCLILDGKIFGDDFSGQLLLLTNDHVISSFPAEYPTSKKPLNPAEAAVRFTQSTEPEMKFLVKRIIWSSPYTAHDVCLFEVEGALPVSGSTIPIVSYVPAVSNENPGEIFVISHPEKETLSFSFQNTDLIDHDANAKGQESLVPGLIHYTTPTIPGSSGGVALNAELEMVGLHHAGGSEINRLNGGDGTYCVNEAVWIQPIVNAIRRDLQQGNDRWGDGK